MDETADVLRCMNLWHPPNLSFPTFVAATRKSTFKRGVGLPGRVWESCQPVWLPGSPAGYDDIAASWAAPDALVRRVEVAQRLAARVGDQLDARALGQTLLGGSLSPATGAAVARAESASTAIALLLVSPDFQRR